ncbi:mechanosensitive ion channel family protein [Hyphobacterium marinum]|uniref:Small-conductance mechanosensitive channel n=1 Tax=Hyphobacterium marinum TaxID=3116574 RepID=A0ABU7LZJ0_9PROT|nr:mechanosensitive ion channel family protein [Hyphobacterium sp. Y6023]MEE2566415.1 mechanosensitive ion channel family protein [Hyphobacterium sp. Y6023]
MEFFSPLTDQLQTIWEGFVRSLPQIGLALIVLAATWGVAQLLRKAVGGAGRKSNMRRALVDLFETLTGIVVWIVGILIAATILFPSVTPAQLIGALGIGGIAIGLAFKDIFENFMAGIMIMIRKPMRIGDVIEVEDVEGKVEEITIRDTYVREMSGELILLPNAYLFTNPVEIKTDRAQRRYDLVVGVAYDEDAAKAREVIEKAVKGVASIDADKGVDVFAREFGASSIDFTVRWWAGSKPRDMHETRSDIVIAIKAALDEAGIEIPFPYRTLTFKEPLPLARASGNEVA